MPRWPHQKCRPLPKAPTSTTAVSHRSCSRHRLSSPPLPPSHEELLLSSSLPPEYKQAYCLLCRQPDPQNHLLRNNKVPVDLSHQFPPARKQPLQNHPAPLLSDNSPLFLPHCQNASEYSSVPTASKGHRMHRSSSARWQHLPV